MAMKLSDKADFLLIQRWTTVPFCSSVKQENTYISQPFLNFGNGYLFCLWCLFEQPGRAAGGSLPVCGCAGLSWPVVCSTSDPVWSWHPSFSVLVNTDEWNETWAFQVKKLRVCLSVFLNPPPQLLWRPMFLRETLRLSSYHFCAPIPACCHFSEYCTATIGLLLFSANKSFHMPKETSPRAPVSSS